MKKLRYMMWLLAISAASSCKKDTGNPDTAASLTMVNANVALSNVAVNFAAVSPKYAAEQSFIPYQSSMEFGLASGTTPYNVVSANDSTGTALHGNLRLMTGGIYSFYITGTTLKTDTVLMKDNIPYYPTTDSVAGARFINLSPDSQPLNIALQGGTGNEFSSLAYKKITPFKRYSAVINVINNGGYIFNVTDGSGNVLTSFSWNPTTFKNNTLVISGSISNGSISVFSVNNF